MTVIVISTNIPFKVGHAEFTTVPCLPLSVHQCANVSTFLKQKCANHYTEKKQSKIIQFQTMDSDQSGKAFKDTVMNQACHSIKGDQLENTSL